MSNFKRFVRLTGLIATLAAGVALLAAIDGAGAKDRARSGTGLSPNRTESRGAIAVKPAVTGVTAKPAATGGDPVRNAKHAIVTKPGHGDDDHDHRHERHHRHKHRFSRFDYWFDQRAYCDCKYQPCRKSSRCRVHRPVVTAPVVITPGDAGPFVDFEPDFGGD